MSDYGQAFIILLMGSLVLFVVGLITLVAGLVSQKRPKIYPARIIIGIVLLVPFLIFCLYTLNLFLTPINYNFGGK